MLFAAFVEIVYEGEDGDEDNRKAAKNAGNYNCVVD